MPLRPTLGLAAAGVTASVIGRVFIVRRTADRVVLDPGTIDADVAAVLGAGLRPDGSPTALLRQRVDAGADLYLRGAVGRLVMSGDANERGHQPDAMAAVAIKAGVPSDRIDLDADGVDTAATCRGLLQNYPGARVVLVTQEFHANRTAYLAAKAGLDAVVLGAPDVEVRPKALAKARVREVPASIKAIFVDRF